MLYVCVRDIGSDEKWEDQLAGWLFRNCLSDKELLWKPKLDEEEYKKEFRYERQSVENIIKILKLNCMWLTRKRNKSKMVLRNAA